MKAFSERFKGTDNPEIPMSKGTRCLESRASLKCRDFLCPSENFVKEWFSTLLQARMRAIALDPYGSLIYDCSRKDKVYTASFTCQDENCHAKLTIHNVNPDPEGNLIQGVYCVKPKIISILAWHS